MRPNLVSRSVFFSDSGKWGGCCRTALIVIAAVALATTLAPVSQAQQIKTSLSEVTVFPDRAELTRVAELELSAGLSVVEFSELPWQVEPDSLRVSAEGVEAILGAIELREEAQEPEETQELIAARQGVRDIKRDVSALDAAEQTSNDLREFLRALRATTARRESERLGEGRVDAESIIALYDLVRSRLDQLGTESIQRQERRRELQRELKVAQARLATARPEGAIRSRLATVEIELPRAGWLSLRLQYVTPGAAWRPAYRASLDPESGDVSLVSEAVVSQNTGEDWSDVTLRLSTASPVRGVRPPELPPLFLRPLETTEFSSEYIEGLRLLGRNYQDTLTMAAGAVDGVSDQEAVLGARSEAFKTDAIESVELIDVEAEQKQAGVLRSSYNVSFEIPGRSSVQADGRDHRVTLRQETLEGEVEYHSVPAANAAAFLVAKTRSPEGYPLLAGSVRVFAAGAYLGAFALEETGPQAELLLPFGIDNRIAVERVPLPGHTEDSGLFGKERRIASAFRTTIENRRSETVRVVMEDRVPVSEDERIRVEMGRDTTTGWEEVKDRPGVLRWELELAPQEKREIVLEFTLRFPKDLPIVKVPRLQ